MKSKFNYAKSTKWIILFTFTLGLLLTLFGEYLKILSYSSIIWGSCIQLGTALTISSILGLFFEITEIKEFFEQRILGILSKDEFIDLVDEEKLVDMTISNMTGLAEKRIDNPLWEHYDFALSVGYGILDNVGEVYRKDYFETIDYSVLTKPEIDKLGLDSSEIHEKITKLKVTTKYRLISPKDKDPVPYTLSHYWIAEKLKGLDVKESFKFSIYVEDEKQDIKLTEFIEEKDDFITFNFSKEIEFTSDIWIEFELISFELDLSGIFSRTMDQLTHNATVHFSSREQLDFVSSFFGITANNDEPSITSNSVSFQYPGWALPGHGYFIAWRSKTNIDVS